MMLLIPAVVAGLLAGLGAAHGFSWDATKRQQALERIRDFQTRNRVPSIAVSVTVGDTTVLLTDLDAGGTAVPEGEDRIRYRIGSVSKQFTAAAVLALIEDKVRVPASNAALQLTTPLSEIFPDATPPGSNLGPITVDRLLTMTSKLPSYTDDAAMLGPDETGVAPASKAGDLLQIIAHLKTYRVDARKPAFNYSNTNYLALSIIIHWLNGGRRDPSPVPVQSFMHQRLLARAGMASTGFMNEPPPPGTYDAPATRERPAQFDQGDWAKGAGDLVSTAADMGRWNMALMSGKVLARKWLEIMLKPVAPVTTSELYRGCQYAMGWYVCDRPDYRLYQHDGVISGFMASNAIARDKRGAVASATILANLDATKEVARLARDIIDITK